MIITLSILLYGLIFSQLVLYSIGLFASILSLYFLPTIVAKTYKHKQFEAIFVLNGFAGWTFVGWIVALVWAFTKK